MGGEDFKMSQDFCSLIWAIPTTNVSFYASPKSNARKKRFIRASSGREDLRVETARSPGIGVLPAVDSDVQRSELDVGCCP
jgi:hypothetical protein